MGNLAVIHDEHQNRLETKLKRELGDQVLALLSDDRTEDILLNPDGTLWVKRIGEGFVRLGEIPAPQASSALSTIAAWRGTVLNHEHPILETELPIDGSRFEGIVSPVVRRPVFAIRLRPRRIFPLTEYEQSGILSGKTTFVNACLDALATLTPHDRVISIEDTTELQCPVANYLDLRAVGNVTMLECLRACMRLKPTRIVVGEVRGAEAHT